MFFFLLQLVSMRGFCLFGLLPYLLSPETLKTLKGELSKVFETQETATLELEYQKLSSFCLDSCMDA